MKLIIKISIIIFILSGHYFSMSKNYFSEFLYKTAFNVENIKKYASDIILQNPNVNNLHTSGGSYELINEFFITILNESSLGENLNENLKSSDFTIINLDSENQNIFFDNLNENFSEENFLKIHPSKDFESINENSYKAFKYDNFSISYLNPKLLEIEDFVKLQRHIEIFKNNFYIPVVLIHKSNLNEKFMKNLKNKSSLLIILDDKFSISYLKNKPLIHIGKINDLDMIFQTTLYISNLKLKKIRFKISPKNLNEFINQKDEILNFLNSNEKLEFKFDGNSNCIYFDYNV